MKKTFIRPVVCICEVNGLVGVVLRKDYDGASRNLWVSLWKAQKKRTGLIQFKSSGMLITVSPIFLFKNKSDALHELLGKCFVERATFYVPSSFQAREDLDGALKYLFKSENNVQLPVSERTDWAEMIIELNALHARVFQKPWQIKLQVRHNDAGCVLNAYREGDVDFGQAVYALKKMNDFVKVSVYKTVRKHRHICSLLNEVKKAGFKGIATQSQYSGQDYPVVVLQDFSQADRPEDRIAEVFLGGAPIKVEETGRMSSLLSPGKAQFIVPKGESIAVWN